MRDAIPIVIAAALFLTGCVTIHAEKPPAGDAVTVGASNDGAACSSKPVRRVVAYANAERRARDLPPLECSPELARLARSHAEDMCRRDYVGHVDPDGVGPKQRFDAQGIDARAIAENVALGQRTPFQVHDGWMHSAGHRKNILHPALRRIGVAVRWCDGRPYWAQMFAGS